MLGKRNRSIGEIVAIFNEKHEELIDAVEEQNQIIKAAQDEAKNAETEYNLEVERAETVKNNIINKAKNKLKDELSFTLENAKVATDNIAEAEKWLEQIPSGK